jgi:predicted phage terminase large subunit-like protein
MTNKEFEKKIQQLVESIKRDTTMFPDDNKFKQRKRIEKANDDFFFFAKTYFPHYIKAEFGKDHRKMNRETDVSGQITGVAGYRGLGKTTLLSIIKPIWRALRGDVHFNCKIAKNETLAKERTEAIRIEFLYNARLKHDYGNQLIMGNGEETDFIIRAGCRFLALGYRSGIRGKVFGAYRPDYIDIDDLEDHEAHNERISENKLKFITEECYGALYKGRGTIVWLGNLTHQKSALNMFKKKCEEEKSPQHKFLIFKADDGSFNPTWPENYTREDLLRIYGAMSRMGYERHMRMNPVVEGKLIKAEWFRYGIKPGPKKIVTFCDPSLGEKTTNDYKAIITVGYQRPKYYVLDAWIRQASINSMLKYLYSVDQEFSTRIYMESNFWQRILWEFIPEIAKDYGYTLPVSAVENKDKKTLRIEKMQPLFEWGWIVFPSNLTEDMRVLIDQLLGFDDYPFDDGPDALAGAINQIKRAANQNYEDYDSIEKLKSIDFAKMM